MKLHEQLALDMQRLDLAGLIRRELPLVTPEGPKITIGAKELINLASSDYLGMATHPEVKRDAIGAVEKWGVGVAGSRMAAGATALHAELELSLAAHLGVPDALLFASGYHAATGLFEPLLSDRDYVFCDELVRPAIADGIRLSRARVDSFRNRDLEHLEERLKRSRAARFRVSVTDGVFALSGQSPDLLEIYRLASRYDALVAVDDSHGIGVLGEHGRGTHAQLGLTERIDVVTGSFACALGGGAGGFVAGRKEIIGWLRQKSRPHLATTALAPSSCAAVLKSLELLRTDPSRRERLLENAKIFQDALADHGLWTAESEHPAVAILLRESGEAQRIADWLFKRGVFAIGFCYPVVPEGQARIRAQVQHDHSKSDLQRVADLLGEATKR
jgi:glycine C-acetyltransferase